MIRHVSELTVPPDDSGGVCGLKFEDGGQAAIMYHGLEYPDESEFFVRLHLWDETKTHSVFRSLMGKRIRITVETLDD